MENEVCMRAVRAAVSVMQETCGGKIVPIGDSFVQVPPVVLDLVGGKSKEEAILAVAHSQWVKGWSKRACELAGVSSHDCRKRLAQMLAEAVVEV